MITSGIFGPVGGSGRDAGEKGTIGSPFEFVEETDNEMAKLSVRDVEVAGKRVLVKKISMSRWMSMGK